MRERLEQLFKEYGTIAIGVYLALFVLTMVPAAVALSMGFRPESVSSGAGILFGAWLIAKATQLPRIAATAAITPFVARFVKRASNKTTPEGEA